jgi:hypothetical protein
MTYDIFARSFPIGIARGNLFKIFLNTLWAIKKPRKQQKV